VSDSEDSLSEFRTRLSDLAARQEWPVLLAESRRIGEAHPDMWEPAYQEGRALLETGAYEHADHHIQLCMDRFPNLPQFAVLYGYVGGRSLDPEAAVERWASMQARMPDAPGLRIGLAHAYKAAGQLDKSERMVSDSLQRMPNNVALLVQYADLAARRNDWDTAATRWAVVRKMAPERLDAVIGSIAALRQSNRLDEAEALAQPALQAHPDDPDLNTSYAAIAAARQDWPETARRLRRVLALTPDSAVAAVGLVGALTRLDKTIEAEQAAEAALRHHPDHEVLLTEYAAIAVKEQRWPQAVVRWQQVYERCADRASTFFAYIDALEHADQLNLADEISTEAVAFAPDDLKLLKQHAWLAEKRIDYAEAATRWQVIKRKFPGDEAANEATMRVRKLHSKDSRDAARDEFATANAPVRGSMRPPIKPQGPPRGAPDAGPTALDILLSGAPTGVKPPPPPPTFGAKLRRLFGK
jgi:predicted Zn-dependent protease